MVRALLMLDKSLVTVLHPQSSLKQFKVSSPLWGPLMNLLYSSVWRRMGNVCYWSHLLDHTVGYEWRLSIKGLFVLILG